MQELNLCPFCGCEANGLKSHSLECFFVLWIEDSISLNVPHELLTKAWNTRAERTCKIEWKPNSWGFSTAYCECGHMLLEVANGIGEYLPNYCPNCGAKVVE